MNVHDTIGPFLSGQQKSQRGSEVKLGLINSVWLGTAISTTQGIELTRQIGFDTIDIFADPLEIGAQERRAIRKTCQTQGLPVISVVCCALGIADFNQTVRTFHVDRAKAFMDFACELEAKNLLLVLGEYIWQQEVIAPKDQWNWAVEQVQKLAEHANHLGIEIAIELEPFHLSIVNNLGRLTKFLDEVNRPEVRANVDISHLALAGDPAEQLQQLAGRIAHVHLSDCDGKRHGDLPPGRGSVDFPPYLKSLSDAGFTGTVSIELEYSPDPGQIIEWVREAYASTDKMMKSLDIRN
jgi:D-psicose/D-tagatose/L-ribulose 3-epimerase